MSAAAAIVAFPVTAGATAKQGWWNAGACAQADPDAWFPEKGGSEWPAKRVCRECGVRAECLEDALERDEKFGIWGGLTERERRKLKRQRGDDAAVAA